ncbi:MAG: hypothetical protein EOP45_01355 [Sphingobacteriaceae bacterium]|nr:MAG: hypothetical protein EOP45_01355 [Sphingobacteriaceae bacterium]
MNEAKDKTYPNVHSAVLDTLFVLNGKWKLVILAVLVLDGKRRFTDLEIELGLSRTNLSRELKELETKGLVHRQTYNAKHARVEYSSTPYSDSLKEMLSAIARWGENQTERLAEADTSWTADHSEELSVQSRQKIKKVKKLHASGVGVSEIRRTLSIENNTTVYKYIRYNFGSASKGKTNNDDERQTGS